MRFWFVLRSPSLLRFSEPVIEELAERGHEIHVSFALHAADPATPEVEGLISRTGASVSPLAVGETETQRGALADRLVHTARDLTSYSTLRMRWPPLLRSRWLEYFPRWVARGLKAADGRAVGRAVDTNAFRSATGAVARRWPVPRNLRRQLAAIHPDVVVASPLIYPGSREIDAVRAARVAGIPNVGLVLSWDNLTSKGVFHARPDRLIVWNDIQVREAVEWHGFPRERVEALGAPVFDYLFETTGLRPRAQFLAGLGLAPDDRYVLYAGSSRLGLGPGGEIPIVARMAAAIASAEWEGRAPVVVVRPHPRNSTGWEAAGGRVVVWQRPGFPTSHEAKSDLQSSLAHADAVVGLNTSVFIDAAIVGTPAIALLLGGEQFADRVPTQVIHFEYLRDAGFIELVDGPEQAIAALLELRRRGDSRQAAREAFVRSFVRPRGYDRAAADVVADRLERIS